MACGTGLREEGVQGSDGSRDRARPRCPGQPQTEKVGCGLEQIQLEVEGEVKGP